MARRLADEIIAWVPVSRLANLYPRLPLRIARVRALTVNGFSHDRYQSLLQLLGGRILDEVDTYIKICTYQGEIWPESHLYLPLRALLSRAAILRNADLYNYLGQLAGETEFRNDPSLVQEALETGLPAIVARAMILQPQISGHVYPGDIAWLPGFARWLRSRWLETGRTRSEMKLAGYVNGGNLSYVPLNYADDYFTGVLEYLSRARPEMVTLHESAEDNLFPGRTPKTRHRLISHWGFYPILTRVPRTAFEASLRAIQPRLTKSLEKTIDLSQKEVNIGVGPITRSVVLRAQEMLSHLQVNPQLQPPTLYQAALRIICGQTIDPEVLQKDENATLRDLMVRVAHPQLEAEMLADLEDNEWKELAFSQNCYTTWVRYDLLNLLRVVPKEYGGLWQIVLLAREGRLLQAVEIPSFLQRLQTDEILTSTGLMGGRHYANKSAFRRGAAWDPSRLTIGDEPAARLTAALAEKLRSGSLPLFQSTAIASWSEILTVEKHRGSALPNHMQLLLRASSEDRRYRELLQIFSS